MPVSTHLDLLEGGESLHLLLVSSRLASPPSLCSFHCSEMDLGSDLKENP